MAGIVVAAATAGLLVGSPTALAHDHHGDGHDRGGNHQRGVVNSQNNNVSAPVQACNNSVGEGNVGVASRGQKNKDSHTGCCSLNNSVKN
jgi:hypothetical protein